MADHQTNPGGSASTSPSSQEAWAAAVALHREGRFHEAIAVYQQILAQMPRHFEAIVNLAAALKRVGQRDEAITCFRRALELNPEMPEAWCNLANTLNEQGAPAEAVACFRKAIELKPDLHPAIFNLGNVLRDKGDLEGAAKCFEETLRLVPNFARAHVNLGNVRHQLGDLEAAVRCHRRAIELQPDYAEAHHNLGNALLDEKKLDEAADSFQAALKHRPNFAAAWSNYGTVLIGLKRDDEAEKAFRLSTEIDPNLAEGHAGLGRLMLRRKQYADALACFYEAMRSKPLDVELLACIGETQFGWRRLTEATLTFERIVEQAPDHADAHAKLGALYLLTDQVDKAMETLRRSLELAPDHIGAHVSLQSALIKHGRSTEAIESCRHVLSIDPENVSALSNLGYAHVTQGDHKEAERRLSEALRLDPENKQACCNLLMATLYTEHRSSKEVRDEHERRCSAWSAMEVRRDEWPNSPDLNRRIRLGYVSADLRGHPVGFFLGPVFDRHDRDRFEIVCYNDSPVADKFTDRLRRSVDGWHDVQHLDEPALAERIVADRIDILVDLHGHTASNRMLTFARKPAPIQVTYLGYPGTTGLRTIDYLLADEHICPTELAHLYTEEVMPLPGCFLCLNAHPEAPPVAATPATSNGYVTFGSFNQIPKLTPTVIAAWSEILQRVPDSRLFLKSKWLESNEARTRFWDAFAEQGIARERIELAGESFLVQMLAEYGRVDIALDPFPYNGGTTTCDALWMGVPVLNLQGDRFCGRMGTSILTTVGLTDWIADTQEAYIDLAVQHASDIAQLANLRKSLRDRIAESPLCDAEAHVRGMEAAYLTMWRRWCERPTRSN